MKESHWIDYLGFLNKWKENVGARAQGIEENEKICNHNYKEFDEYKYDYEGWQGLLNLDDLNLY